jgi:hypothetical protein
MSDEHYMDMMLVLASMPRITIDANVEGTRACVCAHQHYLAVPGEEDKLCVTARSYVTMRVKLTRGTLMDERNALQSVSTEHAHIMCAGGAQSSARNRQSTNVTPAIQEAALDEEVRVQMFLFP